MIQLMSLEDIMEKMHWIQWSMFAHVFEKGESYKHYEELLRQNVDEKILTPKTKGAGDYDPNVKAAEDIRTKVEKGEIETIAEDPIGPFSKEYLTEGLIKDIPEVSETDVMKRKMKENIKNMPAFKKPV